ncbi:hypothetical protein TIFTF001_035792 [Ficus carica]|uniref:Uncharacterized protein n=1 Tax=Ficus carica TaxID=3494 RepID=A0AA88E2K1_FICCA|nr:hypothetical protein TIFTF001_035792 [Ficus carica]
MESSSSSATIAFVFKNRFFGRNEVLAIHIHGHKIENIVVVIMQIYDVLTVVLKLGS